LLHVLGAALVAVVLPALLMGVFVGELGVWAMLVGVLLGVVGCKLGGTRRMALVAPVMGAAAGLGAFTAYDWWWAALLGGTGFITGVGIRFGWFAPLLMVPYAATFIVPVSSGTDAVIYGVIVAIATLYAVVIMRRFSAPEIVPGQRLSVPVAAAVAIVFGLGLGGERGDRRGSGMDGALRGSGAGSHPRALHPHGKGRPDSRKGARDRTRGRRGDPSHCSIRRRRFSRRSAPSCLCWR
jgi:hypothetical protein